MHLNKRKREECIDLWIFHNLMMEDNNNIKGDPGQGTAGCCGDNHHQSEDNDDNNSISNNSTSFMDDLYSNSNNYDIDNLIAATIADVVPPDYNDRGGIGRASGSGSAGGGGPSDLGGGGSRNNHQLNCIHQQQHHNYYCPPKASHYHDGCGVGLGKIDYFHSPLDSKGYNGASSTSTSNCCDLPEKKYHSTSSNTMKLLDVTYTPRPCDCICGRGKDVWNHVGNKRFRTIIKQFKDVYLHCKDNKIEKSNVITKILESFRLNCNDRNTDNGRKNGSSGRDVGMNRSSSCAAGSATTDNGTTTTTTIPNEVECDCDNCIFVRKVNGYWYQIVDEHEIREKCGQHMRDILDMEYKSSTKSKMMLSKKKQNQNQNQKKHTKTTNHHDHNQVVERENPPHHPHHHGRHHDDEHGDEDEHLHHYHQGHGHGSTKPDNDDGADAHVLEASDEVGIIEYKNSHEVKCDANEETDQAASPRPTKRTRLSYDHKNVVDVDAADDEDGDDDDSIAKTQEKEEEAEEEEDDDGGATSLFGGVTNEEELLRIFTEVNIGVLESIKAERLAKKQAAYEQIMMEQGRGGSSKFTAPVTFGDV